jgi:ABC-type siderophore export system fused ATPase/permease subunit
MALIPAWVIGEITNFATDHQMTTHRIDSTSASSSVSSLAYAGLSFFARRRSYILGEKVFAQLREEFLASVLALPLVEVERAGTGDLLSARPTTSSPCRARCASRCPNGWSRSSSGLDASSR